MVSTRSSDLTCRGECHPCLRAIVERAQALLTVEPVVVVRNITNKIIEMRQWQAR
jgi:hypothetical protein